MAAPAIAPGLLVRQHLLERLGTTRVTLITALPGFGKTVTARQWMEAVDTPTAWISLELLDGEPAIFWKRFMTVVRGVCPRLDNEPAQLLDERGPEDPLFLDALIAQLRTTPPIAMVLDGMTDRPDALVLGGIVHLVERIGDVLGLVITTRARLDLPLARWRSAGWLTELGEDDLRLSVGEAATMAQTIDPDAPRSEVAALNRRLDGWPIGLHMALLSNNRDGVADTDSTFHLAAADRALADYLVTGVLSGMPALDRVVALKLSVLRSFDPALCRDLAGDEAHNVINRLLSRGTFLTVVDPRTGVMRFHALFRELMEFHLSLTDPSQRISLHRRAAELLRARGDLTGSYQHLAEIGETSSARKLLIEPALALVVKGDLQSLRAQAHRLPPVAEVHNAELALDLGAIAFYADGPRAAKRWCDHAETLMETTTSSLTPEATQLTRGLHARRCAIALVDADLETAFIHVGNYRRLFHDIRLSDSFEAQFPILAARVMLALRRKDDISFWIDQAQRIPGPELVTTVTVPTLRAWQAWLLGDLQTAMTLSQGALARIEQYGGTANHLTFDTLITAAWCYTATGDLDSAAELSRVATEQADALGYGWQQLQAGYLAARLALLEHNARQALRIIDGLRAAIPFETCRPYSDRIVAIELEARASTSIPISPLSTLTNLPALQAQAQVLRATYAGPEAAIDEFLAEREHWIFPDFIHAELLLLTRRDDPPARKALEELVARCAQEGWVLPFLGLPDAMIERLRLLPLEQIHPRLARRLRPPTPISIPHEPPIQKIPLTSREASLLPLLQTHMTYAEMGERLFLSVNTVKSNLQRLYRKLNAHTRREAVEAARQLGW